MKLFWIVGVPSPKPQDLYLPITEVEILRVLWLVKMSLKKLGKTNWMGQLTDPGGSPLCEPYKYVPSQKGMDFAPRWSENGYRFCPFRSGNRYSFRDVGVWTFLSFNSKWIRKKEICELAFLFKEWRHNFLEVGAENRCKKWHFLVWNRVRIWRTGWHTKNSQESPSPPPLPVTNCAALY